MPTGAVYIPANFDIYMVKIDYVVYMLRKLEAHRSCVNALAFSSGGGRFLASGGDGAFDGQGLSRNACPNWITNWDTRQTCGFFYGTSTKTT